MSRYFTPTHEWVNVTADGIVTIGITSYAQEELGDIVFVDFPAREGHVKNGDTIAVIESVKAASDIISPVSGMVIAINEQVKNDPPLVNHSPEEHGWMLSIRLDTPTELESLMDESEYRALVKSLS